MNKTLIIFLLLAVTASASGQLPFFQQYSLIRKKDPVEINVLTQDRLGYLWIGTTKGLFRFDGHDYIHYTVKDSLPDNNVTALAFDSLGRMWTGHGNGTLAWFDGVIFKNFTTEEGTSTEEISDILFDNTGTLWFGTLNDGLYYFRKNRLQRVDEQEGLPDLYVYDLALDKNGNVLAGTDAGIAVCSLNESKISIDVHDYKDGLPDNIIRKIEIEKSGKLWLATEDAGVVSFESGMKKATQLIQGWEYGPVSDFINNEDHIWIACPQKGLVYFDKKSGAHRVFNSPAVDNLTSVTTLFSDMEGNVWAGTKSSLFRTTGTGLQFLDNEKQNNTLAVTVDHGGNIWYSADDGLYKRTANHNLSKEIRPLTGTPYEKYTVISLYTDFEGYVWAGLFGEGVLRINPSTYQVTYLSKELRNGNVLNITGKNNKIWLATLGGGSRITIDSKNLKVENFGSAEGLSSDFIYQILIDSKDRVWFATDGKGIDMFDGSHFTHFENGLPSKIVYGLAEDKNGSILANVQSNGIYKLNNQNIFEPLMNMVHLRDKDIDCMAVDKKGNLVLLHDLGMDIVDLSNSRVRYLGDEYGLKDRIGNLNAVGKDLSGDLLFGTNAGIVLYADSKFYLDHKPLPLISRVKVFDKEFQKNVLEDLRYNQNNITFEFVGIWFQNPENVFINYKLENYDLEWLSTRNRTVTYSSLPPGTYTFKVKVSAIGDFKDAGEASISFKVHPPFWKTPAFYMLAGALVVVFAFAFMRFRERRLLHEKLVLEAKVRRRTMEVQRQNDEIQAQNEEIMAQAEEIRGINENLELIVRERTAELERKNRALEEYAFINAHKLRSPVASILGLVHLITKTDLDDEGKEISKRLSQSADELDDIVRSITKAIEKGEEDISIRGN